MRFHPLRATGLMLTIALTAGFLMAGGDDDDRDRRSSQQSFIGLWQAIDSFDGSTQHLSITCSRRGMCEVRLNDTAFTLACPDEIGFARGDGTIRREVLSVELTLTCADATVTQFNQFVLDRDNGTLLNLNDDPNPSNIFHKISR